MTRYLTAVKAAERLGRTERTIRRWIAEGRLKAHHIARNRLAIAETDIEQLAHELEQFDDQASRLTLPALAQRIAELENRITELEQQLNRQDTLAASLPAGEDTLTTPHKTRRQNRTTAPRSEPPVPGALLAKDFARRYGVNENTFRDHVRRGIGPRNEKAPTLARAKPNRPGEMEYWILPEQQQDVLHFWDKYGVRYSLPEQDKEGSESQ